MSEESKNDNSYTRINRTADIGELNPGLTPFPTRASTPNIIPNIDIVQARALRVNRISQISRNDNLTPSEEEKNSGR